MTASSISDRDAVIETITRLFWHTDHHEWDAVESVFAERVHLDYTSLQGGAPATLTPAELVGGWCSPRPHDASNPVPIRVKPPRAARCVQDTSRVDPTPFIRAP